MLSGRRSSNSLINWEMSTLRMTPTAQATVFEKALWNAKAVISFPNRHPQAPTWKKRVNLNATAPRWFTKGTVPPFNKRGGNGERKVYRFTAVTCCFYGLATKNNFTIKLKSTSLNMNYRRFALYAFSLYVVFLWLDHSTTKKIPKISLYGKSCFGVLNATSFHSDWKGLYQSRKPFKKTGFVWFVLNFLSGCMMNESN